MDVRVSEDTVTESTAPSDVVRGEVSILAVDDVPENLEVLRALLARPGLRLLRASGGDEALELLLTHDVALALVDVRMPGMSGFELAELMRGSERTRHVPIIFLTAGAPNETRVFRGYEAGAVDFLFKPIDPLLLESKVSVFIELFEQRRRLSAQVEEHRQVVRTAELLIGVLGHDLRTPLSAILTAGESLRAMYAGDERAQKIASTIRTSSQRMTRLIEQLLDFGAARLGGLPVRPRPADLAPLCDTVLAEFRARGAQLERHCAGDTNGTWDPDRLLQVLSNLVGNAVQHGDEGAGVSIRIDAQQPDAVRLSVTNAGQLPDDLSGQLFSPFARSRGRSSGTGLGLYIVGEIARAHGGAVTVRSEAGSTTFIVELPRHAPEVEARAGSGVEAAQAKGA